jgi:hypothetical protein
MGQCLYFYAFLLTDDILQTACQEYSKQLAITFASEKSLFQTSKFSIEIAKNLPLEKEFKQTIGSGEGEMFSLTKEEIKHRLCKFSPCCFYHK